MTKLGFGLPGQVRKDLIQRFARMKEVPDNAHENLRHAHTVDVPEAFCRFDRLPQYEKMLVPQMAARTLGIANPFFKMHEGRAGATTVIDGRTCINFSSYNYLGLAGHPAVTAAAKDAIDRYGTTVSASRLVAGERPIQRDLERALATFYNTDDCVVFVSGHATNVTSIGCLFGPKDLIVHDALIHNSVMEGARLSGAARRSFAHNDADALDAMLADLRGRFERVLIVIEGLYRMDGDVPDLPRFVDIKRRYKAFLMVDEAHSLGVLGAKGGGVREHFGVTDNAVDIWMGTLSKTLAGCGGYICGAQALVDVLKYTSPGFVYSVGIAPPLAAASLAALKIMQEEPERVTTLRSRTTQFLELASAAGLDIGTAEGYGIVPVIVRSSVRAVKLSNLLFDRGINVQPIIYPAVEECGARLRFFMSADHSEAQIRTTVETIRDIS